MHNIYVYVYMYISVKALSYDVSGERYKGHAPSQLTPSCRRFPRLAHFFLISCILLINNSLQATKSALSCTIDSLWRFLYLKQSIFKTKLNVVIEYGKCAQFIK